MLARVVHIDEVPLGSPLTAGVAGGATSLVVADVTDFDEEGQLEVDGEIVTYSAINEDTNTITTSAVANAHSADAFVYVYPRTIDRMALLMSSDSPEGEEGMLARVPHALWDRLAVGIRDVDEHEGETVSAEFQDGELVVTDVLSREPVIDASFIDPATFTDSPSDGSAPASSPTPTVIGGPTFIAARWTAVSNTDPVTYEVHVSTSSGFTPGAGTLYAETSATGIFIKNLPAGTALAYGTTYYVKLVAKDTDGSASASAQGSGSMVKVDGAADIVAGSIVAASLATDSVTATQILAGAVTADALESTLVLSTKIVAGTAGAARIELGEATAGTGLYAYAADGSTVKFSVEASSGNVYAAGRVDFGTAGSRLDSDMMELAESAPASGYQTPVVVQQLQFGSGASGSSTANLGFYTSTTAGNLCLIVLTLYDADGTAPTPTTPGGWALVTSALTGRLGTFVYRATSSASRVNIVDDVSIALNDTVEWVADVMEISGVQVAAADQVAAASSAGSTSPASGSTATTVQANDFLMAFIGNQLIAESPTSITSGFSQSKYTNNETNVRHAIYTKTVAATGTYSFSGTLATSQRWTAGIMALKLKTAAVDTPATNKARIYALDDAHASTSNGASMLATKNERGIEKSLEFPGLTKFRDTTAPAFLYMHSEFCEVAGGIVTSSPAGEGVVAVFSGTGANIGAINVSTGGHHGAARLQTGTTSSGECQLRGGTNGIDVGAGRMRLGSLVRVPTLSTGTERFYVAVGFKNYDATLGTSTTGNTIYLRYADHLNSGKWQAACSDGATATLADSGVTVTAGQWYWIEIDVAADGSEAKFYIDGTLRATIAADMPTGAINHHPAVINKTVGTTSRSFDIDFYYVYVEHGTRGA